MVAQDTHMGGPSMADPCHIPSGWHLYNPLNRFLESELMVLELALISLSSTEANEQGQPRKNRTFMICTWLPPDSGLKTF
jgi:hypothetical protein